MQWSLADMFYILILVLLKNVCMMSKIYNCNALIKFYSNITYLMFWIQTYLKEVLKEIGVYNQNPSHRYMWELKPEYRHHKKVEHDSSSERDTS